MYTYSTLLSIMTAGLQNAVVFGRRTWEWLIREEGKKYANRFNVVITSKPP